MSCAFLDLKKRKIFNFINVDEVYEEVHVKIPMFDNKKTIKYGNKIIRILKKYKTNQVVLSNQLNNNDILKKVLYEKNISIIDGTRLYKAILKKAIDDLCSITENKIQEMKIIVFVHEFTIENMNLIKYIAKNVKSIILVSENSRRYERLYDELLQKYGIILARFNINIKKMLKADYFINIDFNEKELKKYNYSKDSFFISIEKEIETLNEKFDGIIINEIDVYYENSFENFNSMAICESKIYDYRRNCKENERKFNRAGYKINGYLYNNSKINENEIKKHS